ncbi:MAG: phosphodiesterase [Rhodospirillaceae bacterium]|nr:phosphodiesterase [Rhodospirillaceae bacterium]
MIVAQISDMHIRLPGQLAYRKVDTAKYLAEAVRRLNLVDPAPDLVILTGDLVDFSKPEEYAHLAALLAPLKAPFFLVPGNHDDRAPLRAGFPQHRYLGGEGFINYALEDWPVRIVALDTLIPGEGGGELCAERLAWLDRTLAAAPERPTLVAMHHPPFRTGIRHMDNYGLKNADGFAAVIARHRQVERVIAGHLHRSIQCRVGGTVASTCPSTAHQIVLDLRDQAPLGFAFEPPGYQLHVWYPDAGLVTHTAVIGDFDGPYPFRDGGKLID